MPDQARWRDKSGDAEFQSAALTEAARNQISQEIHELAVEAIRRIPSQHRGQWQMMIAVDSRKLPRLKVLTGELMKELRSLVSESDTKDDVYQVEISFFPVTATQEN